MSPEAARLARHPHAARVLEPLSAGELARELERTESDPEGVGLMTRKGRLLVVRLDQVSLRACHLLKQEMLAVGADAAHARGVAELSVESSPVVLLATEGQYQRLLPKLKRQPFRLSEIAEEVEEAIRHHHQRAPRIVRGTDRSFTVGDRPRVMGVVNVTPDSFSDGGRFLAAEAAVARALELAADGADLIDVGGESTRPAALPVDPEEEWRRIAPVLYGLRGRIDLPLSVDTRHPIVAERAIAAGADLINDVGGLADPEMRRVVREGGAAAIAMHMRGSPLTMQGLTHYDDLRGEVYRALADATDLARTEGIGADRLLLDPGLGFAKSAEQSLDLLVHVGELRSLGYPVVVGASRKSFLGGERPADRFERSVAAAVVASLAGAEVVRVHDVRPTVEALSVVGRIWALARARPASDGPGVAPAAAEP